MAALAGAHVAVFGIGGVGSWAAETLARSGVGALTLIDHDTVDLSNINRQAEALHSTVGHFKAEAAAARLLDINPALTVRTIPEKYKAATRDRFFETPYTYVLDCIDLVSCKLDLIESCVRQSIPCISALGTGNKLDAEKLTVTDIAKTAMCPFARVIRKELRRRGILHHTVVYSPEPAQVPLPLADPPPGRRSVPGSVMWVPATAGMLMAADVIRRIIETKTPARP
ncbi:tRNA threonylcarbamoyladenosine dehydratase [Oscillospiraceae bacterium OttesenSCG-928-F05]|nr:tRNA threonylcarbamoyladenosine dehydratase [Oscillospiraceae bacterium OttesenSCG-928-F05]